MKKLNGFISAFLLAALAANAVPAKRGFRNITQPDGSVVEAELVGDEFGHFYLTKDNRPMLRDANGTLRYASLNEAGEVKLSDSPVAVNLNAFTKHIDSRREERAAIRTNARMARAKAPSRVAAQNGMGLFTGNYPRTGEVHALVFLVQYTDAKFSIADPKQYFTDMLNKEGFSENGGTGSARDYFIEQSGGQFEPNFDVFGPITLAKNRAYYGGNDNYGDDEHPEEMAAEAAEQLKNVINFADYDYDGDGYVDDIIVVYAGMGEADGGSEDTVWPHSWEIPNGKTYNGKTLSGYCCISELEGNGIKAPIGTFVHEYSHVMGLPDLYHTTSSSAYYTPGEYSVLDYGPYNNQGRTPPAYGAYERNAMGWLDPIVLDSPADVTLEDIKSSNCTYLIPTEKTTEFFLLENRQQTGWDKYIPGHGMLVWHIDFVQSVWDSNKVNNTRTHQYVDIVEANNNPDGSSLSAMAGYPFPGTSGKNGFTSTTTPALKSWAGKAIDMPITEIKETDGVITFAAAGGNFEFDKPKAPTLTAADNGTITVKWNVVSHATDYVLNVYSRENGNVTYLGKYKDYHTGNILTQIIDGVEPEQEYFATITAAAGLKLSEPSDEASVVTPALSYEYVTPVAVSGVLESNGNVTFSWNPVKYATDYRLTVKVESDGTDEIVTTGFGSGNSATIPTGWTWTGSTSDVYKSTSTGYFGESAPSLKFSKDGATLTTKTFDGLVKEISFFYVGASANGSTLAVEGTTNGSSWFNIATINDLDKHNAAGVVTTVVPSANANCIRFKYTKAVGNAGLDDVKLKVSSRISEIHPDFNALSVGNTTSHTAVVRGNYPHIFFSVQAVDANGNLSRASDFVEVVTPSGVSAPGVTEADLDAPVEYFNLQGCPVANPSAGIYIRRQGTKVTKVIIK